MTFANTPRARARTRAMVAATIGILVAVALTGCLKVDMKLTVTEETVSGTVILALDKEMVELSGQSEEQLLASMNDEASLPKGGGVVTEKYTDEKFVGQRLVLTNVPLRELNPENDPDSLTITYDRDADAYRVRGVFDLGNDPNGEIPNVIEGAIADKIAITIAITFPGEVTRHNGELDGTTVTWRPRAGERTVIEADATGASKLSWPLLVGIGAALAALLVALAVIGFLLLRRRRRATAAAHNSAPYPPTPYPPAQYPPAPYPASPQGYPDGPQSNNPYYSTPPPPPPHYQTPPEQRR